MALEIRPIRPRAYVNLAFCTVYDSGANSLLAQVLVREAQLSQDDERHVPDGRIPRHYRHRDRPSVRWRARPHEHLGMIRKKKEVVYWQEGRTTRPDASHNLAQKHSDTPNQHSTFAFILRNDRNKLRADARSEAAALQAYAAFRTLVPTTRAGQCFCLPKRCIRSTYVTDCARSSSPTSSLANIITSIFFLSLHFRCCPLTSTSRSGPPKQTNTSRSSRCT